MATCANGWAVIEKLRTTGALPRLRKWQLPDIDRHFYLRDGSAGFLLTHLALWWHERVDPLTGGILDEWSWAVRPIRGQTSGYSNHAGGVAIDLDATQFPRGIDPEDRLSANQISLIRHRLNFFKTGTGDRVLGWGGDYQNVPDAMHFELAYGSTLAQAEEVARRILDYPRSQKILDANPGARQVILS